MFLNRRDRRGQIVVDKRFQYRATLIGIVYLVAVATCLALPLYNMMDATEILLEGRSAEIVSLYRTQQTYTIVLLGLFFVGIIGVWSAFTLWRTHKVSGPLVNITRFIHGVASGDFSGRVRLRSKDELQALAKALNDMVESLQGREGRIRAQILSQIQAAKENLEPDATDRSAEAMERLLATIEGNFASCEAPKSDAQSIVESLLHSRD